MKDINSLRKITYSRLLAKYYQLCTNREIEFSCLNQNLNVSKVYKGFVVKQTSKLSKEQLEKSRLEMLNYCLKNIKEIKRLENEISDIEIKLSKLNHEPYNNIKHEIKIENQYIIDDIHKIMENTYIEIEKIKMLEMKEN